MKILVLFSLIIFITVVSFSQTINVSLTSYDFASRRVNCLTGITFNVSNTGSTALQIYSVTFNSARFRFDTTNVSFPVNILPGQTRIFRIWFNPVSAAFYTDTAKINSNAINEPQYKIALSGTGVNVLHELGDFLWETNIPANPNTSVQDYQPKSIKQINDVNGDGIADVIVATGNYWTICYNGNASVTGDTLWKFNTHFGSINTGSVPYKDAVQILQDVDGDGIPEVVIGCGGGNEMVYVLSGRNGRRIWAYGDSIATSDGDVNGLRTDKDYNGDSINDVIIAASGEANMSGRHAVICLNGINGQVIFNSQLNANFTHDVVNLNNGGAIDFSNNGSPYGVRGFTNNGTLTWTYNTSSNIWSMKDFADINNDNIRDVIAMYGFSGGVFALSGDDGQQIWTASLGSSNNGTIETLDDKDKNGFNDLILSGPQTAYRIDSKSGQTLWSFSPSASYLRDADILDDINNDTIAEVLISTQQPGRVYVLNGADGQMLFQYEFGSSISYRADRVLKINSIDGNLYKDFVAGCRDGRLKCFSSGQGSIIGINPVNNDVPKDFLLAHNFPNPFNPVTKIKFSIPVSDKILNSNVKISVFDILGREVETLINEVLQPGTYEVEFDGTNYPSGLYFYTLSSSHFTESRKMILIK